MAVKDWLGITEKTLGAVDKLTDEQVNSLKTSLDRSFAKVSNDMIQLYNSLENADTDYIKAQLSRLNQLKIARQLLSPNQSKTFEKEFKELLENQTAEGVKYADLMTEALTNPPELVQQFGTVNIEASAIAQDARKRLTSHTKEASQKIIDAVSDNLLRGGSVQSLAKSLQGALGTTKARAETIARTETITAFNQSARQRYEGYGTKYLQIIALVDQRTTPWCRYRHLRIIKITDAVPAYHWNCRSTTAPVDPAWIDDEDLAWMQEEMRRAKDTGLNISGKAPFDTKKPSFLTPKTFAKKATSVPTTPTTQRTKKSKATTPVAPTSVGDFVPSKPYPNVEDLTTDQAIQIGREYFAWAQQKNGYQFDLYGELLGDEFPKSQKLSAFVNKDLRERGREAINNRGFKMSDYYKFAPDGWAFALTAEEQQRLIPVIEDAFTLYGGFPSKKITFGYSKDRASYAFTETTASLDVGVAIKNKFDDRGLRVTVLHEMGHGFEAQSQRFVNNSVEYVLGKATGPQEKLSKLIPSGTYREDEYAYPGDFIHPYAGKVYETEEGQIGEKYKATEIFSMGLENFANDINLFVAFTHDPTHLEYVVGSLLTTYRKN